MRAVRLLPPRFGAAALLALAAAAALTACGKSSIHTRSAGAGGGGGGGTAPTLASVAAQGAVSLVTKNTARLGGADPASDAAAVARAVYPALTPATRPQVVVVVDQRNWGASLAASVLAGAQLRAPLLFSEGGSLPEVSGAALEAMRPAGSAAVGGAQVIELGTTAALPGGLRSRTVTVPADEAAAAVAVERLLEAAHGARPRRVIVVASDAPRALQMPAAGLAAESGAPILFTRSSGLPATTRAVLARLRRPSIYLVGSGGIATGALRELARFGPVTPVAATSAAAAPVENAIAVARFTDGAFGWGVKEPGHGLVFANAGRPLDAPAAAPLSASGQYGPLLLLESAHAVPPALATYLSDIQPAYGHAPQYQPVHGAYNHGWLIGDEGAISAATQAELDAMLEIVPAKASSEEAPIPAPE
ncbi:MAG TPA: hypothetical protein VHY83_08000 [Solirubrobacteraceae bacterium]|jgi:hypothetical protein|nr:hypothetical protein [Solirubrobacteraceae bacterium]